MSAHAAAPTAVSHTHSAITGYEVRGTSNRRYSGYRPAPELHPLLVLGMSPRQRVEAACASMTFDAWQRLMREWVGR